MLKLISKQKIAECEWEGKLLLNDKIELTFYKFDDGIASGTRIFYNDEVIDEDVESAVADFTLDIVNAAIGILK